MKTKDKGKMTKNKGRERKETQSVEYSYIEYDRCQVPKKIVMEGSEEDILEWIQENVDAEADQVTEY